MKRTDGPTRWSEEDLGRKRYVVAGDRAFAVGVMDGSFPFLGSHIKGLMGGVWVPPIKLLDGYWVQLDGSWLPPASRFTTGPGYVQMDVPPVDGLSVTRTELAPDGLPVLLVRLEIENPSDASRGVTVGIEMRSRLMCAYPWQWTRPTADDMDRKDWGSVQGDGRVLFCEPGSSSCAVVGASPAPDAVLVGDEFGSVRNAGDDPDDTDARTAAGRLEWEIEIPAGETFTLWLGVAGSHTSDDEAREALRSALVDPEALLDRKIQSRLELLQRTRISLPNRQIEEAFDWAKLNLADLSRTVTEMQVRDVECGTAYADPIAILPAVSGVGAGYPDYPWYFGTDGSYTGYGLIASGQWETVASHQRAIRDVSRVVNGPTGKVVHEVVYDGAVFYGNNAAPGNTNETAQFAMAVDLLWRWSGDNALLDEMYEFVRDGLRTVMLALTDGHGPWPSGTGMVERHDLGPEVLDVTSYTWKALGALARMAESRGDMATAAWASERAHDIQTKFDEAWWMPDEALYADSLDGRRQLQQWYWICATPMEMGLAPVLHARAALDRLESPDFTGETGLYHAGGKIDRSGARDKAAWTLATSVMAAAETAYGRVGERQALFYIEAIAGLLDIEMPGAFPEIAPSPDYDPFVPLEERAMVMQAWSAYGVQWPIVDGLLGVRPDVPAGSLTIVPNIPPSWPGLSVENLRLGSGTVAVAARRDGETITVESTTPADLRLTLGCVLPDGARPTEASLDGEAITFSVVETSRGTEVHVEDLPGGEHRLRVLYRHESLS